jgi:hypothetical protein
MRLLYLLIPLLFPAFLAAQTNCQIFDLTATAVDFENCEFYVVLNFEHSATTNQFTVQGNGTNYGTFAYSSNPLTLGPFAAAPNAPTTLEFVVRDVVFPGECFDEVTITVPPCATTSDCEIFNVTVEAFDCNPGTNTYHLLLDFDVANPTNDFFEVWSANGTYLGIFPLAQLPVTIPNFPWNGQAVDLVKVCLNDSPDCCRIREFAAPACATPCPIIQGLTVQTGPCFPDSTYTLTVNFELNTPQLTVPFIVYANGVLLDTFVNLQLPLTIEHFPWNGGPHDVIEVCLLPTVATVQCCVEEEFAVPLCLPIYPCSISDLVVDPGTCTSDSTFSLVINFEVGNPAEADSFNLRINGQSYGTFATADLPLTLDNVEWNGLVFQDVRVATGDLPTCVRELQFVAPDCLPFEACHVTAVMTQVGPCTSDTTYRLRVNFQATNPGNGSFTVSANGVVLDTFALSEAPVLIADFPWGGDGTDVVTLCVLSNTPLPVLCCAEKEVTPPACMLPDACEISGLHVETGDCTSNTTYEVTVSFDVTNPPHETFTLYANGAVFGTFNIDQLPLHIEEFPYNGGPNDVIKVCFLTPDAPDNTCCAIIEFPVPDCLGQGDDCEIVNLHVETGDCTSNTTYEVWVNFEVANPPHETFTLFANGTAFGTFNINQLPLHIEEFPYNGGPNDFIKICFLTPNAPTAACCETIEFPVPDCLGQTGNCDITNLVADTGDCTSDSTYNVWINFNVANPPSNTFTVYTNGVSFGTFNVDQLPVHLVNVVWNGGPNDFVKVCFANSSTVACCETVEYAVPDCLEHPGGTCEITNLHVETGDCTSNTTYEVWVDFDVVNAPANSFVLYANGTVFGTFNLDQLPLHIEEFPYNGGPNDVIKVCFATLATPAVCCETIEFPVPDCLGQGGDDCHILDVHVVATPCICGQFFALVTYEHENADADVVDIFGNGTNYGTFPYNQQQPILIGPLAGGTGLQYEFVVRDHQNHDCQDFFVLGAVNCQVMAHEPTTQGAVLALSPNPATDRVNATTQWQSGAAAGAATVEVFHADGRRVLATDVPNSASFHLEVDALPAGMYRVVITSAVGRVEGTFAKQ